MKSPWTLVVLLLLFLPWTARAQVPAEGVPIQVRRGFFVETDVGLQFTVGGHNGVSNAQTFLQLGLGADLGRHLELGAHFGLGASADTCFAPVDPAGFCTASENFTLSFLGLSAAWRFELVPRLSLAPKLVAGWTLLDPAPKLDAQGEPFTAGPHVGGGVGIEYATAMDHFSVGADVLVRYVIGPGLPSVAVLPRVKYTF
ncbi:MAG TPA: adventurous gliding motility protein CglE [Myxococcaceae bacterium]|nr:adventurous gliding motility protein CglE [Myxococcaceae bacterium]